MEFNPYKVLSLSKDASLEDIKRYKKLARKYHPTKLQIHSCFISTQHIKYYLITN